MCHQLLFRNKCFLTLGTSELLDLPVSLEMVGQRRARRERLNTLSALERLHVRFLVFVNVRNFEEEAAVLARSRL